MTESEGMEPERIVIASSIRSHGKARICVFSEWRIGDLILWIIAAQRMLERIFQMDSGTHVRTTIEGDTRPF